jgi:uncharacterized protein (TIGR04168 family)
MQPSGRPARIAVIGDVHMAWDRRDDAYFRSADYDLLLCVGDLADMRRPGLSVARRLASLPLPTRVLLGNHDGVAVAHLAAEALGFRRLSGLLGFDQLRRVRRFERILGERGCGYSRHELTVGSMRVTLIAARPHSMGGKPLSYPHTMARRYGVGSIDESARRLCQLVDAAESDTILWLAHNGPHGLGASPADLWGCDFKPELGDFGDCDLETAIEHARASGRRVAAVLAGHMHHRLRGGGTRSWRLERDGTLYVNAARVPRIFRRGSRLLHHHVRLELDADRCWAREELVE